jgi:hypothetical protein
MEVPFLQDSGRHDKSPTVSSVRSYREFAPCVTNGFGDDFHGSQQRRRHARKHHLSSWIYAFLQQFRNDAVYIGREGLSFQTANFPLMLHVSRSKSTPEIRKSLADLSLVAGNPFDNFRTRRRRVFRQRFGQPLADILTHWMCALRSPGTPPAGSQLRSQFRETPSDRSYGRKSQPMCHLRDRGNGLLIKR